MLETKPEPGHTTSRTHRLLVYVLSYDELTANVSTRFDVTDIRQPLSIRRADAEGPPALDGDALGIGDGFMSSSHATLKRQGSGLVVADAGSRNGTWVNGKRIDEHRLVDGDLIEVGHSLLCYRELSAPLVDALDDLGGAPCLGPTTTFCGEVAAVGAALAKIGPSTEPVLVLAETGSGKEVTAAAIHAISGRSGAFRAVDCGAIPESLFESTFFGHRKGAFTGADEHRTGEIANADGGTLFLDEVGNMSAASQAKLLRVIETGQVTPVGASEARAVDVRWVAATNRDLFATGDDFREDLLRRLAGYVARIPPLRRRREDLGVLTSWLLRDAGVDRASIVPAAARSLFGGPLSGNIRELRAALRSASLLADGSPIEEHHLPERRAPAEAPADAHAGTSSTKLDRDSVAAALRETSGNVVRAASLLGTHARQVYRLIERFDLDLDSFRGQ